MNIKQLASGTWRARVYAGTVNGKSIYKSITGSSKKEVELQAAQLQMEQTKQKIEKSLPADKRMSVGDAIDQYINNVIGVLSPTTIRRYQKDRQKFFRGIMDIKLHDLTQADVQQAVSLDSKRFAPKSIHCTHGLLSAALNVYRPDFQLRTNLPQKVEPDLIVPENDDIQRLLKRVEGTRMECAILLGGLLWVQALRNMRT